MKLPSCPSPDQLRDFTSGRLADEATETLAEHLDECPTCREIVAEVSQSRDPLVVALREPVTEPAYSEETDYQRAMEMVEAIGRNPETAAGNASLSAYGSGPGAERADSPSAPGGRQAAGEGAALEPAFPLGTIREYQLQRKLGEGGMGAVYQALHTRLDKLVAIKVLPADRMRDAGAVARFQREMKAVGRLDHPNIVRAMDAGEENGLHFLVMEYVPGVDLAYLSRARGPLPIADACELVRQAALGLAEAHEHGMVHRDIKPSNLILAQPRKKKDQPTVKILDLGLALLSEALSPDQQGLTSTGQMMGTIDYMAPEQGGDSHQVDIRADLYSLGATLYKLLTGDAPFAGEKYDTPVKKLMALATQQPPPVRSRRAEVPGALASLVENLLAKDPGERLATPDDVAEALEPFCRGADLGKLLKETTPPPASVETGPRQASLGTQPNYSSPSGDTAPTLDVSPLPAGAARPSADLPTTSLPGAARRAASSRNRFPPARAVAIACGMAGLAALLGTIFFIQTGKGTVQIEINDPAIQVVLDNDGKAVIKGADKKHEIKIYPGSHGLTISRGDFSFDTPKFELKRKEVVVLKVEYLPGKVRVARASGETLDEKQIPNYALQFDGVDDYVELPTLKFDPAEAFTMEIWAEVENPTESPQLLHYSGVPGRRAKIQFGVPRDPTRPQLQTSVTAGAAERPAENPIYGSITFDEPFAGGELHAAMTWSPGGSTSLFWNGQRCPKEAVEDRNKQWPTGSISMIGANPKSTGGMHQLLKGRVRGVRISRGIRYSDAFTPETDWGPDANTLALYRFDEGAGDTLYDTSGNGHHGKIVGARWVKVSDPSPNDGTPLEFDGVDDYVVFDGTPPADPVTVEAWITPRYPADERMARTLFNFDQSEVHLSFAESDNHCQWVGARRTDQVVRAAYDSQPLTDLTSSAGQLRKVHVAAQWQNGLPQLRIDGVEVAHQNERPAKGLRRSYEPRLVFGAAFQGAAGTGNRHFDPFAGRIHAIRVSSKARYTGNFTPPSTFAKDDNTWGIYDFAEGQGDQLTDSSGNGHHGKIIGAKWVRVEEPPKNATLTDPSFQKWLKDVKLLPAEEQLREVIRKLRELNPGYDGAETHETENSTIKVLRLPAPPTISSPIAHAVRNISPVRALGGLKFLSCPDYKSLTDLSPLQGMSLLRLDIHGCGVSDLTPLRGMPLTYLHCSGLPVSDLSPLEGMPLETLLVDQTRVSDLSPLTNCRNLRWLHIEATKVTPADISALQEALPRCKIYWDDSAALPGGSALRFDESRKEPDFSAVKLNAREPWTVEGWVTPRAPLPKDGEQALVFLIDQVWLSVHNRYPGARWTMGGPLAKPGPAINKSDKFLVGERTHVALQHGPNGVSMFVNGVRQGEPLPLIFLNEQPTLRLFSRGNPSRRDVPFIGDVDEIRVSKIERYQDSFSPQPRFDPDADTVALYHCDEGTGDVLTDSSANGHHGKIVGAKWTVVEPAMNSAPAASETDGQSSPKSALQFADDLDQVRIEHVPGRKNQISTVEAWVWLSAADQPAGDIVAFPSSPLLRLLNGKLAVAWSVPAAPGSSAFTLRHIESHSPAPSHRWIHLAAANDGNTLRLFVDGKLQAETPVPTYRDETNTRAPAFICRAKYASSRFRGRVAEVRVSSSARYVHDFEPPALGTRHTLDNDTVALYHCDEGTGDVLTDSSGNNYHGKIVGARWVKAEDLGIRAARGWHGWPPDAPTPAIAPFDAAQAAQHQKAWADYLGIPIEYTNSIGMKFRLIPPGEYAMGSPQAEMEKALSEAQKFGAEGQDWQTKIKSESPQHKVVLTQPVYLGVTEVTQKQYEAVMGKNPSHFAPQGAGKEAVAGFDTSNHPVESIDWNDAAEFCSKLSQQEKRKPFYFRSGMSVSPLDGDGYRLPTEAEWEFACRAGTTTLYSCGNTDAELLQVGWFGWNADKRTHQVGELKANPFGLYDIHGNVWEWAQDSWNVEYYSQFQEQPAIDPQGAEFTGEFRVLRGGNWVDNPAACRSSRRRGTTPQRRETNVGFRAALVITASDRAAAEYAISLGGWVSVNDDATQIRAKDLLPKEDFRLTTVEFWGSDALTDEGLRCFRSCSELKHLNLGGTPVGDTGLENFKGCTKLRYLNLYQCRNVTDAGVLHFPALPELEYLMLNGTQVGDRGAARFSTSGKLTFLGLSKTQISNSGLAAFSKCSLLSCLDLHENPQLGDEGLVHFRDCRELTKLTLQITQISDQGLKPLITPRLVQLEVGWTKVTDEILAELAKCENLTSLWINDTGLTDGGLTRLHGLKHLTNLLVTKTAVTKAGVELLHEKLPDCKIDWDGGTIQPGNSP